VTLDHKSNSNADAVVFSPPNRVIVFLDRHFIGFVFFVGVVAYLVGLAG
jgi:hypothetical protein